MGEEGAGGRLDLGRRFEAEPDCALLRLVGEPAADRLDCHRGADSGGRRRRLVRAPDELPGRDRDAGAREKLLRLPLGEDRSAASAARDRARVPHLDLGREAVRRPRLADVGRRLDRREPLLDPGKRRDPAREKVLRDRLRKRLGEGREHAPARAGPAKRGLEGVEGDVPLRVVAAIRARRVDDEERKVEPAPEHRGECGGEAVRVPPDEGVVVEGVRDGDEVGQGRAHPLALRLGEGGGRGAGAPRAHPP